MSLSNKFASDRIFIDSLRLKCTCGPDAFGRTKLQPVILSMELKTSLARAAASDRVDLSVDYSALNKQFMNLDNTTFEGAPELLNRVADLALRMNGVASVCVIVELERGALMAKKVKWERTAFVDNTTGEWKVTIEGIEVPIIIGIDENVHERTMKQMVHIDLSWNIFEFDTDTFSSSKVHEISTSIREVCIPLRNRAKKSESI